MADNWRDSVDPMLRPHLEAQINATGQHRHAYSESKDAVSAQLWVAIANISKQLFDMNLKLNYLEQAMKESMQQPQEQPQPRPRPVRRAAPVKRRRKTKTAQRRKKR